MQSELCITVKSNVQSSQNSNDKDFIQPNSISTDLMSTRTCNERNVSMSNNSQTASNQTHLTFEVEFFQSVFLFL